MPTQADFENAAGVFDRSAEHIDDLFVEPRRLLGSGVLVGGLLTTELHALFEHVRISLDRHSSGLRDLAATCRDRAEACAAYESQMRSFESASDAYQVELRRWTMVSDAHGQVPLLVPPPGPPPTPPVAPAAPPAWMSRGRS